MKKYLITGIGGFVARHFLERLDSLGEDALALGLDLKVSKEATDYSFQNIKLSFMEMNLLEYKALEAAIVSFKPDYIAHFASFSSVGKSWEMPMESFMNNAGIFLNVAEIARRNKLSCRILSIGSSEEYGSAGSEGIALREDMPPRPGSPYAIAKASQEMLGKCYAQAYKLDIVSTRSFNHVGAGQRLDFALPSFAKQIADGARLGHKEIKLMTGDISIERDFIDARDAADAYIALLKSGRSGEVYNVCSGKAHSLREAIRLLANIFRVNVTAETDPKKLRPADSKVAMGDFSKIKEHTGWEPRHSFEESLRAAFAPNLA